MQVIEKEGSPLHILPRSSRSEEKKEIIIYIQYVIISYEII